MSKTVLITGAGSGFGRAAAVKLASLGHAVIATTETQDQADELAAANPELTVVKLDITNEADVALVDNWEIDVAIANAAMGQTGPLSHIPIDQMRKVFEVNVFGTLAICQRVAQQMKERRAGRILIVSSIAAFVAGKGAGPYCMSKHAVQAMGGVLRDELADFGIDVATINPGPYATGFNDRMAEDPGEWFDRKTAAPEDVAAQDGITQLITVDQMDPEEVADVYVQLVEADSTEPINFVPADIMDNFA